MITSSTLVETVSIDYDNFTEDFLTCPTCLCPYDAFERSPKQLTCSHAFCKACLEKITNQPGITESFRCPICRESIVLPRGGVNQFPASFVVNQLLDLVNKQRREVVPKCSTHLQQQLLFCEPCDIVFCTLCTQNAHQSNNNNSVHQVIPFSIAIKRMSEILLYKSQQCIEALNEAHDNVSNEIRKLDQNAETTIEDVNRAFQEIIEIVNRRKEELICHATKMQEEKRQVLQEQLNEISSERNKVQNECNSLQYQVDVRNITKKITDLNDKIEQVTASNEPKENCFMRYEPLPESSMDSIRKVVDEFGNIRSSKTFPSLCEVTVEKCAANLRSVAKIVTYDYTGSVNKYGGDPVTAELLHVQTENQIQTNILDKRDGTYDCNFVPLFAGKYHLSVCIFGRPIRTYPLEFEASAHVNPICVYGCRGSEGCHTFNQPVSLAISKSQRIYVLDNGNNRIKVLSQNDCSNSPFNFIQHFTILNLKDQASTGLALKSKVDQEDSLVIVNWRTKSIIELDACTGALINQFTHPDFVGPTLLAVTSKGEIVVVDNDARSIFIFSDNNKLKLKIDINAAITSINNSIMQQQNSTNKNAANAPSQLINQSHLNKQSRNSTEKSNNNDLGTIYAICLDNKDNIVLASTTIAVFSSETGCLIRTFNCTSTLNNKNNRASLHSTTSTLKEGLLKESLEKQILQNHTGLSSKTNYYSGLAYDKGFLLATRMEKKTYFIQVFDYETGQFKYIIDSNDARLRRPTGLATTDDYHCIVVDLGNDCIKKYRYY